MGTLKKLGILVKSGFIKAEKRTFKESIRFFIKLFLILIFLKILYLVFTFFLNKLDVVTIPTTSTNQSFDKYTGIQKFLLFAFLAPILEELSFRLGLKYSKWNFIIMFAGLTFSAFKIIFQSDWTTSLLIVGITTLLLVLILKNQFQEKLNGFWENNHLFIFYFLLFSFTLLHSTNYELSFSILLYIPILILPQLLG
ncbi:hypothetical protein [Algibacter lectus]|uniref:Uncharacterized protein n=1 Tax=Algibacter lectus TaxID=221126 RepID=A0A090VNH0_9FLAO|nr:hypothetical protein [Algibacter lectus]GAL64869.1 hypothetical protein JCM19300_2017 [Algibacter lectus]